MTRKQPDYPDSLSGGDPPRGTPDHRIGETRRRGSRVVDVDPAATQPEGAGAGDEAPNTEDDATKRGSG